MNRRKLLGSITGVIAACSLQVFGYSEKVRKAFCSVKLTKVMLATAYKVAEKWGGMSTHPRTSDRERTNYCRDDIVEFTIPEKVGWKLESVEGAEDIHFPVCETPEAAFSEAGFKPPGPQYQITFVRPNGRGGWTQLPEA